MTTGAAAIATLADRVLDGDRRALARALSIIEDGRPGADDLLARLFPHTGRAHRIGITGAPGTGKSTLVSALARAYRSQGKTVAVLAVDPSSPFSGGAILGDRIRMRDLSGDPGVFIRSMATRGALGGLAAATGDAARALDAAGFEIILIETVGAGQNEVAIARMAQTTIVVEAPGLGDDVQAIKAGILEIADILVVNKADRPGANATASALRMMLELGHPAAKASGMLHADPSGHHGRYVVTGAARPTAPETALWMPPIVLTSALNAGEIQVSEANADVRTGIDGLIEAIAQHRAYLEADANGAALEAEQIALELSDRLRQVLLERLLAALPPDALAQTVRAVQARSLSPGQAVAALIDRAVVR